MLFPIDTVAALMILFALLQEGRPASVPSPGVVGLWGGLAFLFVFLAVALAGRLAEHWIMRTTPSGVSRRSIMGLIEMGARIVVVAVFWGYLSYSAWPFSAFPAVAAEGGGGSQLLLSAAGILPYVLLCFASWVPLYPLHRRITAGEWTLWSYLLHKVRYSLFVLALALPAVAVLDAVEQGLGDAGVLENVSDGAFKAGAYAFLLLSVWLFPFFLRFFWGCRPLPPGALRDRIAGLQEKAGVPFSNIFIWNLGGNSILNAAAVGVLPPFRYLFLSRALLDTMDEEEVDAVVCHELGHVRYYHLLFYLVLTVGTMECVQSLLLDLPLRPLEQAFLALAALAVYIRFGFGFLSRHFERQADLTALDLLGDPTPLIRALETIGAASGGIRHAPSWHHLSIAERVDFLKAAAATPVLGQAHHARVRVLVLGGYVFAAVMLAYSFRAPLQRADGMSASRRTMTASRSGGIPLVSVQAHWTRVARFLPDDPTGPLVLAELALRRGSPEAERYSREALRRARTQEERDKATLLLQRAGGAP